MNFLKKILFFVLIASVQSSISECSVQTEEAATKSYSVNLMWVNDKENDNNTYIFPEEKAFGFIKIASEWAKCNPQSSNVCIWYDSKFVNHNQVVNTNTLIQKKYEKVLGCGLLCKDLRDIPLVKENEDVFSNKMPVYFRVDLLRAVIADHLINNEQAKGYIVYSDFNVPWLSYDQLFNDAEIKNEQEREQYRDMLCKLSCGKTIENLNEIGLVLAKNNKSMGGGFPYENAFYILDCENQPMVKACRLGLIDINIQRALRVIKSGKCYNDPNNKLNWKTFNQVVFASYGHMIKLFYYFSLKGEIVDDPYDNPCTIKERLTAYDNCVDLFETKSHIAKFELKIFSGKSWTTGEDRFETFERTKTMVGELKIKQVEKPISSFYDSRMFDCHEETRQDRDNERLAGIFKLTINDI